MNINQFWTDVLAQNVCALKSYFHPNAYVNRHCTNEHFTADEFIRANCEYPGKWDGEIERIEQIGSLIITVTHVYPQDKTAFFYVTSFIRLTDDKIISIDEYWSDCGEVPKWRLEKHIGQMIRPYKEKK